MRLSYLILQLLIIGTALPLFAQSELYPRHFDLEQVPLLDSPMKTAMQKNIDVLLAYDADRLLSPYVMQSGLASTTDSSSPYYQWMQQHPNFINWSDDSFDLSGHVGGHYLSALVLAFVRLKERR